MKIIGPSMGSKPREILVTSEEAEAALQKKISWLCIHKKEAMSIVQSTQSTWLLFYADIGEKGGDTAHKILFPELIQMSIDDFCHGNLGFF